jgi:hypothetical protein
MANLSHRPGDLSGHPDVDEMNERYARMLGQRNVVLLDGPLLLAGLYCAISPWVVHFSSTSHDLMINNLIIGIAVAVLGYGLAMGPGRMYGLSGACAAMGVWLIISPWVVARHPDHGMIINNVIVGAVTCLIGLAAAAMLARRARASGR